MQIDRDMEGGGYSTGFHTEACLIGLIGLIGLLAAPDADDCASIEQAVCFAASVSATENFFPFFDTRGASSCFIVSTSQSLDSCAVHFYQAFDLA